VVVRGSRVAVAVADHAIVVHTGRGRGRGSGGGATVLCGLMVVAHLVAMVVP
jgi:hypothetical protein